MTKRLLFTSARHLEIWHRIVFILLWTTLLLQIPQADGTFHLSVEVMGSLQIVNK